MMSRKIARGKKKKKSVRVVVFTRIILCPLRQIIYSIFLPFEAMNLTVVSKSVSA